MSPVSTTYPDALWEAAQDTDIPDVNDKSCWPLLKMFLKGRGVDHEAHTEAEWKKAFNRRRRMLNKELEEDKGKAEERSPSTESERKTETGSTSDSAYHSDSPQDHGDQQPLLLYALVKPSTDNPEGKTFMVGCFSDDTDEDYIIQTLYDRLKPPKGKDGKVRITYISQKGGTEFTSRFAVREDSDGEADIVFTRRRPAQKEKLSQSQQHAEDHGIRDLCRSMEASGRLQKRIEEPMVENTLARLFLEEGIQDLPDEKVENLGRKVMLAVRGAKTVNDT